MFEHYRDQETSQGRHNTLFTALFHLLSKTDKLRESPQVISQRAVADSVSVSLRRQGREQTCLKT